MEQELRKGTKAGRRKEKFYVKVKNKVENCEDTLRKEKHSRESKNEAKNKL